MRLGFGNEDVNSSVFVKLRGSSTKGKSRLVIARCSANEIPGWILVTRDWLDFRTQIKTTRLRNYYLSDGPKCFPSFLIDNNKHSLLLLFFNC